MTIGHNIFINFTDPNNGKNPTLLLVVNIENRGLILYGSLSDGATVVQVSTSTQNCPVDVYKAFLFTELDHITNDAAFQKIASRVDMSVSDLKQKIFLDVSNL